MNFRSTYILLGVVVVALLGLGIYVLTIGDKKTSPSVEGYILKSLRAASIDPDKVTAVDIERPGQTPDHITFTRDGKLWKMTAPTKTRTDSSEVDRIVRSLLDARTEKSADLAGNLGAHGLDNPPVKVTLTAGNISETVSLGNVTIGGDKAVVYVVTSDQPDRPQAARRTDFNALFKADAPKNATNAGQLVKTVADFRPLRMIGAGIVDPTNQVVSMAVRAGKDQLALFRPTGGAWQFRLPAGYGNAAVEPPDAATLAKDNNAIHTVPELLNTILSIQPGTRSQIIEKPGDLAQYGLDPTKNAPLQIDFTRDDGEQETLYVGGPIKDKEPGKPDHYYARNEGDTAVAEVPAEPVKKVLAVMADKSRLRDKTILRLQTARVDAIDVVANGETVELRKVGAGWQVYDAEGKGKPAKTAAVTELLNRLTAKQLASGFPPPGEPDNKVGLAPPVAELRFWEGGIVPEKKDEKAEPAAKPKVSATPTARLLFGHKAQGDVVYARRVTGDPKAEVKADYFVPADVFALATRGRLDYIEGSLKPLNVANVVKLTFTHGKDVFEVSRSDTTKPIAQAAWTINSPERLKGRPADGAKVSGLVSSLSIMQAVKVAADKLTPDVLNRLEVNPDSPRMKVTVSIKDPKEAVDRVYLFGGDAGTDKRNVYLKSGDQDLVFEVDRSTFDLFQKADVQEMVVHRIDKTKVKAVKITGWQEVLGTPTTLVIDRKDGKWTLTSGGKFELDPKKVDAFLDTITTPRAEAFVVYKDGPKPEHNLDVAKNALAIELVMDNNDVVKMAISPPNKEGKVFATSSLSPGDVFTMADQFAAIRAKPAAFKKD